VATCCHEDFKPGRFELNSILEIKLLLNMTHKNQLKYKGIYLLRKIICLFCGSCWYFPSHNTPLMLSDTVLESPWWIGLHWDGLLVFSLMVQELLTIEQFSQRKFNKIKSKYLLFKFWPTFYTIGKHLMNTI
jgi:hypothetical protein